MKTRHLKDRSSQSLIQRMIMKSITTIDAQGEIMKRNTITIVGQRNQFTKDWVELEVD
jgi:hypothetical protein